jgi:D-3-phosphoglycerate dehydrogenase
MDKPFALYYRILKYQPENLALLHRHFDVMELDDPRQDTADLLARVNVLFAPLGFAVDAEKIAACPRLRAVVSNTTGIPHIDAAAAAARNIAVCALHDEQAFLDTITPTAELTIGLMLAAWRRIPASHTAASAGKWDRRPWGAPAMMSRLRLGLVGYGRLGRKVAKIAESMGMAVQYYDPHVPGGAHDLLQMAAESDVLSLHAVANTQTRNLVSRAVLETLPRGAMVVNTARGELLDTEALLDLLESGHLYCAAIDTVDGEYAHGFSDRFSESRLATYARNHDNLLLTPHIGGSTYDAWRETEQHVVLKAIRTLGLEGAS